MTTEQRFSAKVAPPDSNGCSLWTAGRFTTGYGQFQLNGRPVPAHRVAYALAVGPIPAGLHVLHRCDVPLCVNVRHLFLGTNADNVRDMVRKGRQARLYGEANGSATLTAAQVAEIRARWAAGGVMQKTLAEQFGVSFQNVSKIVRGERWMTVP